VRKQRLAGESVQLSAADPLNLTGIILPGPRVPAIHANTVTYLDGAVPNEHLPNEQVPNEQVSELA
jgi:ATP-dependent Lhr-like helicase